MKKFFALTFLLLFILLTVIQALWVEAGEPIATRSIAVETLNGGDGAWAAQQVYESRKYLITQSLFIGRAIFFVFFVFALILWVVDICTKPKIHPMKQTIPLLLAVLAGGLLTGCMRPYNTPSYVEIGTSETAFMVPLEGDGTAQAKFDSEAYLDSKKVQAKRIQIPRRWNQTGRLHFSGEWIDSARVIKVNRSPVTRQWSATSDTAVGSRTASGAIWIESADSIGFSMGFNCTAYIAEQDAAKFLYWYKGDSLEKVMDTEIKARYQQAAAEVAAKRKMDILREEKQSIVDAIKADIVPFFAQRGITITTIGQFGGMTYENRGIQDAIDKTFIAQQEKVEAAAKLAAQDDKNKRIELEANATAEKERREAMGIADARMTVARAEATAIQMVNKALTEANSPTLIQLKSLEVEKARVEKWNGQYPSTFFGAGSGGSAPGLLLTMPGRNP